MTGAVGGEADLTRAASEATSFQQAAAFVVSPANSSAQRARIGAATSDALSTNAHVPRSSADGLASPTADTGAELVPIAASLGALAQAPNRFARERRPRVSRFVFMASLRFEGAAVPRFCPFKRTRPRHVTKKVRVDQSAPESAIFCGPRNTRMNETTSPVSTFWTPVSVTPS